MGERNTPVAYVTDLEGQWPRWLGFVARNPLVSMKDDALRLADGADFVFGGDAIDRGPDSLRIQRMFLDAKARYGERVVLLAGNRDVNKLRLVRELGAFVPERAPAEARESRASLLRWILATTMGAGEAFAHRASELEAAGDPHHEHAVVDSFLADLDADGLASRYLAACQLAHLQNATLFVHGGLSARSLGHVPGRDPVHEVERFVSELNAFYRASIDAFRARRDEGGTVAPWQELVSYQAPSPGARVNEASVVYGRLSDEHNNPFLPDRNVVGTLAREGIRRLVIGHTPSGDTPAILRGGNFELVVGDNSRSRVSEGSSIVVQGPTLEVRGSVRLDDGEVRELSASTHLDEPSAFGLRSPIGRLVKGVLPDGRFVLYRGLPGYVVEQTALPPKTLHSEPLASPWAPPRLT